VAASIFIVLLGILFRGSGENIFAAAGGCEGPFAAYRVAGVRVFWKSYVK
jgi:hypothetical protein